MAAAHIATVRNILSDQFQRARILANHPFHAEFPDLVAKGLYRQLELSLLHRDRDKLVRKWCALAIGNQRMQQRQAVLTARNADRDAIIWLQHLEPAHRATHQIQNALLDVHAVSLPVTVARKVP